MKIMNKIWLLTAMFAFSACGSDETIVDQEEPEKELKEYTVSLKMGGEVTTSESPLARAETESDDLYGVQVYRKETGETSYSYFAYGLFDNVSDMKINLLEGSTYKFVVLLIKKGKNIVTNDNGSYGDPFLRYAGTNSGAATVECTNYFIYGTTSYYSFYGGGLRTGLSYSEGDTYYGEVYDYTPSVNGTVEVDLKHTVFGLQYAVTGITDGTVSVTIKKDNHYFFKKTDIAADYTSEEKIISFYDVYNAWQYADNYTENLTVSLSWTRGVGVVQNLGIKTIQVKRNVMNVVRIQLGSNDGSATFGITTEDDSSMTEETVDVPLG